MAMCSVNNDGASGPSIVVSNCAKLILFGTTVKGGQQGGILADNSEVVCAYSTVK